MGQPVRTSCQNPWCFQCLSRQLFHWANNWVSRHHHCLLWRHRCRLVTWQRNQVRTCKLLAKARNQIVFLAQVAIRSVTARRVSKSHHRHEHKSMSSQKILPVWWSNLRRQQLRRRRSNNLQIKMMIITKWMIKIMVYIKISSCHSSSNSSHTFSSQITRCLISILKHKCMVTI